MDIAIPLALPKAIILGKLLLTALLMLVPT